MGQSAWFELAKAIRLGDMHAASEALDLVVRNHLFGSQADQIAQGRAAADKAQDKYPPLPSVATMVLPLPNGLPTSTLGMPLFAGDPVHEEANVANLRHRASL